MTSSESVTVTSEDIEQAFEQSLFSVVYQKQVALDHTHTIVGAEAFVRLNHPTLGVLNPHIFLPQITQCGRMLDLTRAVITQVAKDWVSWHEKGLNVNISVNIDRDVLNESNLARELGKMISEFGIPKHRLTLEFSNCWKNGLLDEGFGKKLLALRMKGYNLSVDDYGLEHIDEKTFDDLPLDEIKIHPSITKHLAGNEKNQATLRQALRIASKFGLKVVAVGVENQESADWLNRMGCDRGQGFLFSAPLSESAFMHSCLQADVTLADEDSQSSILIIEDDPQYQTLLLESLSDKFNPHVTANLQAARQIITDVNPSIIVVDVHLPDGSGIDFCKENYDKLIPKSTSIIFISGGREFESKLEAYEVGGIDFIEKPFPIAELVAKIQQVVNYQSRRRELISDIDDARQMVAASLRETAYYGDIVQFFKNLLLCQDEEQIAKELFRFMSQKNLHVSVEFRGNSTYTNFDQITGICSPIELNVFEVLRTKGRIYQFGKRIIVNDAHISFLIKNIPDDDTEQGKIRDYVAVLIEGMEARYLDILRQRIIKSVMQQLQGLAEQLVAMVNSDQSEQNQVLEDLSLELSLSFHTLDLTAEQEDHISGIVEDMLKSKQDEAQNTQTISEKVNQIIASMSEKLETLTSSTPTQLPMESNNTVDLF